MRANLSQISSATTGQVASNEPRPISRQPVLPRRVTSMPLASGDDFHPAVAVSGLVAATIQADNLGSPQAAREVEQEHGAVAQAAKTAAVERFQHGDQILGEDGGAAWVLRMPAITVAICRSWRSSG